LEIGAYKNVRNGKKNIEKHWKSGLIKTNKEVKRVENGGNNLTKPNEKGKKW